MRRRDKGAQKPSAATSLEAQIHEEMRRAYLASFAAPDLSLLDARVQRPKPKPEPAWETGVGSLIGYRLFKVDNWGRLRPGVYDAPYAWRPGENVAECWKRHYETAYSTRPSFKRREHRAPAATCDCGFYARTVYERDYFDAAFDLTDPRSVSLLGVIEGYGRTEIGTKGFRSEKAKVLALYVPGRKEQYVEQTRLLYPNVEFLSTRADLFSRWPDLARAEAESNEPDESFWQVQP